MTFYKLEHQEISVRLEEHKKRLHIVSSLHYCGCVWQTSLSNPGWVTSLISVPIDYQKIFLSDFIKNDFIHGQIQAGLLFSSARQNFFV